MNHTLLPVGFVAALVLFQPVPRDRPTNPAGRLVGHYTLVGGELPNGKSPSKSAIGARVQFTKDLVRSFDARDNEQYVARYVLDTTQEPWVIHMTSVSPKAGDRADGIVALEGDTLRLCYALPGGKRPREFKTGDRLMLFTMKRDTKK
ncbi:MAG: TIGR03067 domain-containing protein [Gemmataceae bacterium]